MPLVRDHEVHSPADLASALDFLAENAADGWQPVAGGTDVMVFLDHGRPTGTRWLDLWPIRSELGRIERDGDLVRVGGGATMTELRRSALLERACPMIAQAAATVGARQIQNRATVAGNIANASPAGDTLPVWLALDAEVELVSAAGSRRVPYRDFTTAYRATVRRPDELISAVVFAPLSGSGTRFLFRKIGTRAAQAISKVVLAAVSTKGEEGTLSDVRLAFGSMAPVPLRARTAESAARGGRASPETTAAAVAALDDDLSPMDDVRSDAAYRRRVASSLVRAFLDGDLGETLPG